MKISGRSRGAWILGALIAVASVGCTQTTTRRPAATTAMTPPMVMDDGSPLPPQPAAPTAPPSANDDGSFAGHPEQRWGRPNRAK